MIGNSTAQTRLCPYCANTIADDASDCRYCKADFSSQTVPQWLKRNEPSSETRISSDTPKKPVIPAKFVWMGAMFIVVLIAYLAGGYMQRNEQSLLSQAYSKRLQEKDQMIQTQETQLAQTRQQLTDNSTQLAEMKTKLEESQKELARTQQRLAVAARPQDRSIANQPPVARRTASRAPDASAPLPQPVAARRTAASGVYETTRPTSVHEDASQSSRVITQIDRGTRINVVGSSGDWLEIRSKRGNPPGYVRSDDARQISAVN